MHVLDDPARAALTGPHAPFAERRGAVLRYPADVAPWATTPRDAAGWADLAALVGPGGDAWLVGDPQPPGPGWTVEWQLTGVQYEGSGVAAAVDPDVVRLGAADVPAMLDLVERTRPGPFRTRTHELGTYLGFRVGGVLVAMAGERLRVPGWTEISAVCTDPAYRGKGLAARLMRAVAADAGARGDRPFLHTGAANPARHLYEQLGFTLRREVEFAGFRAPVN